MSGLGKDMLGVAGNSWNVVRAGMFPDTNTIKTLMKEQHEIIRDLGKDSLCLLAYNNPDSYPVISVYLSDLYPNLFGRPKHIDDWQITLLLFV